MKLIHSLKHIIKVLCCMSLMTVVPTFTASPEKPQQAKRVICCCGCCACIKIPCFCCKCWCCKCCAKSCCLKCRLTCFVKSLPQGKLAALSNKGSMDLKAMSRDSGDLTVALTFREIARQTTGITAEDALNNAAKEKERIAKVVEDEKKKQKEVPLSVDVKSAEVPAAHLVMIQRQQAARAALRTASKSGTNASTTANKKPFNGGMVRATRSVHGAAYETTDSSVSPSHPQSPHQLPVPHLLSPSSASTITVTVPSPAPSPTSAVSLPSTN